MNVENCGEPILKSLEYMFRAAVSHEKSPLE